MANSGSKLDVIGNEYVDGFMATLTEDSHLQLLWSVLGDSTAHVYRRTVRTELEGWSQE
jgi:hypothetical protein